MWVEGFQAHGTVTAEVLRVKEGSEYDPGRRESNVATGMKNRNQCRNQGQKGNSRWEVKDQKATQGLLGYMSNGLSETTSVTGEIPETQ